MPSIVVTGRIILLDIVQFPLLVVVEQGVIDIEQEYDQGKLYHPDTSMSYGLCQPPAGTRVRSISGGPHVLGS